MSRQGREFPSQQPETKKAPKGREFTLFMAAALGVVLASRVMLDAKNGSSRGVRSGKRPINMSALMAQEAELARERVLHATDGLIEEGGTKKMKEPASQREESQSGEEEKPPVDLGLGYLQSRGRIPRKS